MGICLNRKDLPGFITDAEQTAGELSTIDLHTTSGAKRTKESDDDASDTSLFYKETVGAVEYSFKGVINLADLQFIPISDTFDRMAVNPDDFEKLYRSHLESSVGSKVDDPGFYLIKSAVNAVPEEGVLLNPSQTALLVKEFFKRLLALNITRSASGYASLSGLQIKFVHDPITDKMDDIKIKPDEITVAFGKVSKVEAETLMEDMTAEMARAKEVKKESKEKKAKAKKEKKNATESTAD